MKKVLFVIAFWFEITGLSYSQENLGIANSNYAPTNSIFLNPSSSADSKVFFDFNLGGTSIFAQNNYAFLEFGILGFTNNSDAEVMYDTTNAPYKAYIDYQYHGPSLSLSYGKFGLGITTSIRSATSVNGIPRHLANHAANGFNYLEQQGIEYTTSNARIGTLTWLEIGGNFSYIVQQKGTDMLTVGGTLKYLNASAGAGININKWNYQVQNDSVLNSYEIIGNYGISDLETEDPSASKFLGNGGGIGLDLGFNYKKMLKSSDGYLPHTKGVCESKDYKYKFGLSLIDIGRIKIRDGFYREFNLEDSLIWEDYNSASPDNLTEIDTLIHSALIDNRSTVFENTFKVLMPTALSAQFDYNLTHGFYLNSTIVHGFNRKRKLGVERFNTLSITPRYERKEIDAALPITLIDYEKLRIGAAIRIYYLIIGTDNLASIFGNSDTYGTDFYFSMKYTMFKPWYCKEKTRKGSSSKRRKGKSNPCPSW